MRAIWHGLPLRVARVWPAAGVALGDGHYLMRWPAFAYLLGPTSLAMGVVAGAFYDGLLVFIPLGVIAQGGAALGLWATLGYVAGGLFLGDTPRSALSYVLLGLLTVVLPLAVLVGRHAVTGVERLSRNVMPVLEPACAALVAGIGAFAWARSGPLLTRTEQFNPWILAGCVAAAAVGRVVLERQALPDETFREELRARARNGPLPGIGGLVLVALGALGATWMLSGLITNLLEAAVVLMYFGSLLFVRFFLLTVWAPVVGRIARVPMVIRAVVGFALAYLVSKAVTGLFAGIAHPTLPVLVSVCLSAAVLLLFTLPAVRGEQEWN